MFSFNYVLKISFGLLKASESISLSLPVNLKLDNINLIGQFNLDLVVMRKILEIKNPI